MPPTYKALKKLLKIERECSLALHKENEELKIRLGQIEDLSSTPLWRGFFRVEGPCGGREVK